MESTSKMKTVIAVLLLGIVLLLGAIGTTRAQTILLQDDFNDNSLNASLWTTVTTGFFSSGTSIAEQNQRIEMVNRPYLVTAQQFDPLTVGPLRITGRWTANSASDNLSMVTRSDAVRTINFGNVNLGIECRLEVVNDRISINIMSGGSPTELASVSVPLGAGDVFDFEILDNGSNISFTITEVGGDGTTATVSAINGTDFSTDFVVFYNRELISSHVAFLDDVTIESLGMNPPVCAIQLNKTSFVNGEKVIAQVARLANPGRNPVPVEVKLWFEVPGSTPVPFLTVGAEGSFVLSPGSNHDYGPLDLATVQASYPRGPYEFNCRLLHAVTGAPLGEDFNPFQLQ